MGSWKNWFRLSNYSDRVVKSVIPDNMLKKLSIILILTGESY